MDSGKSRDSLIETILQRVCYIPYRTHWHAHQVRLGQRASRLHGEGLEFDQISNSRLALIFLYDLGRRALPESLSEPRNRV